MRGLLGLFEFSMVLIGNSSFGLESFGTFEDDFLRDEADAAILVADDFFCDD